MTYLRSGVHEDTDPRLVEALQALGDEHSPIEVAVGAAGLTDPNVLLERLGQLSRNTVDGEGAITLAMCRARDVHSAPGLDECRLAAAHDGDHVAITGRRWPIARLESPPDTSWLHETAR